MSKKTRVEIAIIAELRRLRTMGRSEVAILRNKQQRRAEAALNKIIGAIEDILGESRGGNQPSIKGSTRGFTNQDNK